MCLGIPGQIVEIINAETHTALAEVSGVRRSVNLSCVLEEDGMDALVGCWVLIHVGFAMSRIDEDEAQKTLAALHALGEVEGEVQLMKDTADMLGART